MGEYLMKIVAPGRFESFSAGADPKSEIHPMTRRVLKEIHRLDVGDSKPKSWDVFKDEGVEFDFVITVCDNARETCPVWPGQPICAHWGSRDPAAAEGTEEEIFKVFKDVSFEIRRRIEIFTSLPFQKLDRLRLSQLTRNIGNNAEHAAVQDEITGIESRAASQRESPPPSVSPAT